MKVGIAGSVESNDALITVQEADQLVVEITSIVDAFFHDGSPLLFRSNLGKEKASIKTRRRCTPFIILILTRI